jgi:hypothetical protein
MHVASVNHYLSCIAFTPTLTHSSFPRCRRRRTLIYVGATSCFVKSVITCFAFDTAHSHTLHSFVLFLRLFPYHAALNAAVTLLIHWFHSFVPSFVHFLTTRRLTPPPTTTTLHLSLSQLSYTLHSLPYQVALDTAAGNDELVASTSPLPPGALTTSPRWHLFNDDKVTVRSATHSNVTSFRVFFCFVVLCVGQVRSATVAM